jgi:hypothetical protein
VRHNGEGPVIGLDVDGTLGDYHGHFLRFAEGWLGREMPDPVTINPGLPLHKFMKTSKSTYRKIKLAYREGGLKRSMPCYEGARDLAYRLRQWQCEVWICTSRPYLAHGPIVGDTQHWLRRNKIQHDNIIWGEHKYRTLRKMAGNRVVGVLEDLPVMIRQATDNKIPVLLRTQPYNRWMEEVPPVQLMGSGLDVPPVMRVDDLWQAIGGFATLVEKWKRENIA